MSRVTHMYPKSEVLPIHLLLLSLMYLHDLFCGPSGVIKFDIGFMVPFFFENIHFLLILKYLVHYLGLSLTTILAYAMLNIV